MSSSSKSFTEAAKDEEPTVKSMTWDKVEPLPNDDKDMEQGPGGGQDGGEGERTSSIVASPSAQAVELSSVVGGEPAEVGDE